MPAYQSPLTGDKRKLPLDTSSRKKVAIENAIGGPSACRASNSHGGEEYWMIQWRLPQYKKHKTWDGDAVLVLTGIRGSMFDLEGKIMGAGSLNAPKAEENGEYQFGGKEIRIDHPISRGEYMSGKCYGRGSMPSPAMTGNNFVKPSLRIAPLPSTKMNVPYKTPLKAVDKRAIDLHPVNLLSARDIPSAGSSKAKTTATYWTANWRKPQSKKHKTWDGDAFVSHVGDKLTVISEKGKILGRKEWDGLALHNGYSFSAGGKQIELDSQVPASRMPSITGVEDEVPGPEEDVQLVQSSPSKPSFLLHAKGALLGKENDIITASPGASKAFVPPASFYGQKPNKKPNDPLHDPEAEGAIVMKATTPEHARKFNKKNLPTVAVVLDPIIARHLRPHQVEGLKFLYECVMGLRRHEGQGCILADEMGLGKTLQTIALVWTLLKQNPYVGAGPAIGKALIVCPVSLVNNWRAEFQKWLGKDRVGVFTGDKNKSTIKQFLNSYLHQVLVIGYEKLRTVIDDLAYCNPPIGLVICDEGHRLKSSNTKTSTMFKSLRTVRRIILSGTPIQNDLGEFHAMVDFCNPGLLDDHATFRKVYEVPILKSRVPDCTDKELELGEARSAQLSLIAKSFVLRREANILKNYLPPKHEYVVFVTPTQLQLSIFSAILNPDKLDRLINGPTAESLVLINMLTKISNSPVLLKAQADKAKATNTDAIRRPGIDEALSLLPKDTRVDDFSMSGKLLALSNLLKVIRERTREKCIIVSHYTSTLNLIEAFCKKKSYTYFRLDGQTPAAKRQEYVNTFNKSSQHSHFLFLLSSKAGGVGLNLIGASRLCLIDSDWNPSHDLQSMARIHRDGQKRPVFIYRFLTAGTIDEKIYQRQVTKIGLSNFYTIKFKGSSGSKSDSFSRKDLRDIFRVHPETGCNTHDLLDCGCDTGSKHINDDMTGVSGNNIDVGEDDDNNDDLAETGFVNASQVKPRHIEKMDGAYMKKKQAELASLGEWTHINCLQRLTSDNIHDDILRHLVPSSVSEEKEDLAQPQSRIDSLLSAVDLDNITAMDEATQTLSVRDVPGGTISFLFEKTSVSTMEENNVEEG
ncbi:P-loop containing nucleoside triphosphate hydrolase protein [Suillus clintonianus]|uniref:P-loop containing nucleoside triphosphate hydrolase protein n=1 Tax=Suillus clintonianus TaxID=1904413 RepID=UPI001B8733F2|nr:P-loop containing nucleoside triphosphate hydrolase protein [Suillus clintonianus]KAG2153895.1 P-loop containing nucleoside triphosphate hydrolase protein [Suillus clintonianus]